MTIKTTLTQNKCDQVKESVLKTIENESKGEWYSLDDIIGALETKGIFVIDSEEIRSISSKERKKQ